jgi:hypothetical protein
VRRRRPPLTVPEKLLTARHPACRAGNTDPETVPGCLSRLSIPLWCESVSQMSMMSGCAQPSRSARVQACRRHRAAVLDRFFAVSAGVVIKEPGEYGSRDAGHDAAEGSCIQKDFLGAGESGCTGHFSSLRLG